MPPGDEGDAVTRFKTFFTEAHDEDIAALTETASDPPDRIRIDWETFTTFDADLATYFREHPADAEDAARDALQAINPAFDSPDIYIEDLPRTSLSDIRAQHLGQIHTIYGTVSNAATPQSVPVEAAWCCQRCGTITRVHTTVRQQEVTAPSECQGCERGGALELDSDRTEYTDAQSLIITERMAEYGGYEDAESLLVELSGELVGKVTPGDHVAIQGILLPEDPGDYNHGTLSDKFLHATKIQDANPYEHVSHTADKQAFLDLSNDPDIYQRVVNSIAPSVHGYDHEKLAIALQLFSGIQKELPDGTTIRGNIHTLLLGDPGVAKSKLLRYAARLAPSAVQTSGKETTTAGLTAAAAPIGEGANLWQLEGGALVLGNHGLVALDDLTDLHSDAQTALHGVMEDQEVQASKATVTETLAAQTSVLAAGNPKYGRFDPYEPIGEQFDLHIGLITQFDLIFTLIDKPDEDHDETLASHALDVNHAGEVTAHEANTDDDSDIELPTGSIAESIAPEIPPAQLRAYIAFARQTCFPTLSEDAKTAIREFYVDLRANGQDDDAPVPVTARKLEGLVRLAEASARMRLSDTVEEADAERVIELVEESLRMVGVDADTGEFDADIVDTGRSKSQRERTRATIDIIKDLSEDYNDGVPHEAILERAEAAGRPREKIEDEIERLKRQGDIYEPQHKRYMTF